MDQNGSRAVFGPLFASMFQAPAAERLQPGTPAQELERALEQASRILAERSAARAALQPSEGTDFLEAEILRLHQMLGTGLTRDKLGALGAMLRAHAPDPHHGSLEARIDRGATEFLFLRSGERAWDRLQRLMGRKTIHWPVPPDLERGRSPEDFRQGLERRQRDLRRKFLGVPMGTTANLVLGEPLRSARPEVDPRETALEAVGAALRAQLFGAALKVWRSRPVQIEERVQHLLADHLHSVHGLLGSGFGTVEQALLISERVEQACRQVIPELVWSWVEPRLSWEDETALDRLPGVEPRRRIQGPIGTSARITVTPKALKNEA
ncbi:MAG: hypothetical protein HY319_32350 [Armatimonadetes bacterium]|nr:hypothetical protein [Armatimonadota bacterium]